MSESHTQETSQPDRPDMYHKLGAITRHLHDALNELGYVTKIKGAVEEIPDARSRLQYIARLTGEAAEKVLNQVDQAKVEQEKVLKQSKQLVETIRGVPGLKWAMPELLQWAEEIHQDAERTDQHLTEIMMAQDFHDLTGQVIAKVVALAGTLEEQLLNLLLEAAPQEASKVAEAGEKPKEGLEGPVVNAEGRTDVVTDQSQVDDLLASLGF